MTNRKSHDSDEEVAQKACDYARTYILLGTTQLINNTYTVIEKNALAKALCDLRIACLEYSPFLLEIDTTIKNFYQTINLCKKFSLGNCHELALMALDYVVNSAPGVEAEVVRIKGGDHAFLVIGRKLKSDIERPETWGSKAYICDPWANEVFPASDFFIRAKNFYHTKDPLTNTYVNFVEHFKPEVHTIVPLSKINTYHIRATQSEHHLKKIIKFSEEKNSYILNAMKTLEDKLTDIAVRLIDRYGRDTEQSLVIHRMILQLHVATSSICARINKVQTYADYCELRVDLERSLKQNVRAYNQAVKLSAEDSAILSTYQNEHSISSRLLRFFNIPPQTLCSTNKALNASAEEVQTALNLDINSWTIAF